MSDNKPIVLIATETLARKRFNGGMSSAPTAQAAAGLTPADFRSGSDSTGEAPPAQAPQTTVTTKRST